MKSISVLHAYYLFVLYISEINHRNHHRHCHHSSSLLFIRHPRFVDIDECATSPCRNGGDCVDGVNGYACSCPDTHTGLTCELQQPPCAYETCGGRGRCLDDANDAGFTCDCEPGFTGQRCEYREG